MKKSLIIIIAFLALTLVSCSSAKEITRIDPNSTSDLSEGWNDTDFKIASQALVDSCMDGGWLTNFYIKNQGKTPLIIVGNIKNLTSDHIETSILSKKIEVALLNSGEVETSADFNFKDDIRAEQLDQQYHASSETAVELGNETGANFMLQGSIKLNLDRNDNKSIRTYYIDVELIDLESAKKVWVGYYEIKKQIKRNKFSW